METLASRITAFGTAADEESPTTGISSLRRALRAKQMVGGGPESPKFLAVIVPARIDAHQIALKRRLFAPRLIISASAVVDVLMLDVSTRRIVSAKTHSSEAAFQVRFPMLWWAKDETYLPTYRKIDAPVFDEGAVADLAAPGWYHDTQPSGMLRWWNGTAWTEHLRAAE